MQPIAITQGDPAGIGPEIVAKAFRDAPEVLRHCFVVGDVATLRRELVNHRLLARESDCSAYWKLPARPDDEARALMAAWRERQRQRDGARALAPERQAARAAFTQRLRASGPSSAGSSHPG